MTRVLLGIVALSMLGLACRQREPHGDPRTPPNSPLPRIERPDDEQESTSPPPAPDAPPSVDRDAG